MAILLELLKQLTKRPTTTRYPQEEEESTERSRGKPQINAEKCTRCQLCARNCPTQAILIGKPRTDEESLIYLDKCIFCGLCEELCPFDAIKLSSLHEVPTDNIEDLAQRQ